MLTVADGERHGYAIRQEVEERTEGRVRLWPTTLYGAIAKLVDASLLEEAPGTLRADDDPRRRYYQLTAFGHAVLDEEVARLEALVNTARAKRRRVRARPA